LVQYLRKNFNTEVHQLFIDFKKACDSVRKVVLHNILIEFSIPINTIMLIKVCLKETYSRVWVGKYLSDMFIIENGLKKGNVLLRLLFNFALEYAIKGVRINQDGLKLNATHQLLVYADYVTVWGGSVHTIKKNREALVVAS
jgi:hypothetical protein